MISHADAKKFVPRSFLCLKNYSLALFKKDLLSGLTVGVVALPLAMAFAISSGVKPEAGLYTAIVAGFIVSAFGGSRTQIAGPTGAFVIVIAGIVEKHGVQGLYLCTLMAGMMLIALGVTGLGTAVRYIPRPVIIGFTNGIAVLIASTQIKDFFGLQIAGTPADFIGRMETLAANFRSFSPLATSLSVFSLLLIITVATKSKRIPGSVLAVVIGTSLAIALRLPVETVQTKFGGIPHGLPTFAFPSLRPDMMLQLLSPAITVAMLGAIESLLSAVVADTMSNDKHNPNVELLAQGIANVVSPLVGGLPATGAIARTATNIRSGAQTPVSGMIHSATLLVILLGAAPLAERIPLSVLAAILLVVSYNMGEWREIPEILRLGRASISVWLITFVLTVFADLTVAVEAGIILAALLYIRKVTRTTTVAEVTPEYIEAGFDHSLQCIPIPAGVRVFRIHGPFLFGASEKLGLIESQLNELPSIVILRLRNMTAIDATGLFALETLAERLTGSGRTLLICGMRDQPAEIMRRAQFEEIIGKDNFLPSFKAAVQRAEQLLAQKEQERPSVH